MARALACALLAVRGSSNVFLARLSSARETTFLYRHQKNNVPTNRQENPHPPRRTVPYRSTPRKMDFRSANTAESRASESARIRKKYCDRVPVVVERHKSASKDTPMIDKQKFLVPKELTMGQFIFIVRKRLKISPTKAIFVMTESGVMVPTATLMSTVDEQHANVDGFCYLIYSSENTFGSTFG